MVRCALSATSWGRASCQSNRFSSRLHLANASTPPPCSATVSGKRKHSATLQRNCVWQKRTLRHPAAQLLRARGYYNNNAPHKCSLHVLPLAPSLAPVIAAQVQPSPPSPRQHWPGTGSAAAAPSGRPSGGCRHACRGRRANRASCRRGSVGARRGRRWRCSAAEPPAPGGEGVSQGDQEGCLPVEWWQVSARK